MKHVALFLAGAIAVTVTTHFAHAQAEPQGDRARQIEMLKQAKAKREAAAAAGKVHLPVLGIDVALAPAEGWQWKGQVDPSTREGFDVLSRPSPADEQFTVDIHLERQPEATCLGWREVLRAALADQTTLTITDGHGEFLPKDHWNPIVVQTQVSGAAALVEPVSHACMEMPGGVLHASITGLAELSGDLTSVTEALAAIAQAVHDASPE
jgi:hypothetical protein